MAASSSQFSALSLDQVLEDLSSRFIVNLPPEELESIERICFQIEQAHWFYEDFIRPQASHLPSYTLRKFSEIVFKTSPLLSHYNPIDAYDHFLRYKERVPVCGAIILSDTWDKCLLVKGWKSSASWSFPRGKINQGENERDCSVREVWEETGYDISPHFDPTVAPHPLHATTCPPLLPRQDYPEDDYLEVMMKEQRIRLYIVPGVREDTLFETKTRKEISSIAWAPLADLPTWSKKNKGSKKDLKCYMVTPFVGPLRAWIADRRTKKPSKGKKAQAKAAQYEQPVALQPQESTEDLAATSHALQTLFFGSSAAPAGSPPATFEPTTVSPKPVSTSTFTPTVVSPHPQTSPRGGNMLLDILSGGQPNFSGQSTASMESLATTIAPVRTMYTEDQREQARGTLLQRLAEELGSPTPPSPEEQPEELSRTPSYNGEPDDCQSPVHDLLDIFRAQTVQDGRQLGDMRMTQAVMRSIEDEQTRRRLVYEAKQTGFVPEPPSAASHLPALLQQQPTQPPMPPAPFVSAQNYPAQYVPGAGYSAQDHTAAARQGNGAHLLNGHPQTHNNPAKHQANLLNLLKSPAPPAAAPATAPQPPQTQTLLSMFNSAALQGNTRLQEFNAYVAHDQGQADLARLFADART